MAQSEPGEVKRPAYQFRRSSEDWSVLRGATSLGDAFDPIKYVPLNDAGDVWMSFGGHARARGEYWNNFAFGVPPGMNDDAYLVWRLLLHGDFHFGEHLRVFVEGKSALATHRDLLGGNRALDIDTLDLEQAFADVMVPTGDDSKLTIRPGRQVLMLGQQRLVSPLAWSNTMRRWDGVSARFDQAAWRTTAFWARFVPVRKYEFNRSTSDIEFWGLYSTGPIGDRSLSVDAYYLGLDRANAVFNGTMGHEERQTIGASVSGAIAEAGFDYDVEAAYQFGRVGAADVSAYMFGTQLGFDLAPEAETKPRLSAGLEFGSGDSNPGGDVQTFNQLFPLGHAWLGLVDIIARQNIYDLSVGTSIKPAPKLTFGAALHWFWRHSRNDALYNAGAGVVRAGTAGSSREVGTELDLTLNWAVDPHTKVLFGYSHFFAGDFIRQSGPSSDIDFGYVQAQYTF